MAITAAEANTNRMMSTISPAEKAFVNATKPTRTLPELRPRFPVPAPGARPKEPPREKAICSQRQRPAGASGPARPAGLLMLERPRLRSAAACVCAAQQKSRKPSCGNVPCCAHDETGEAQRFFALKYGFFQVGPLRLLPAQLRPRTTRAASPRGEIEDSKNDSAPHVVPSFTLTKERKAPTNANRFRGCPNTLRNGRASPAAQHLRPVDLLLS
jgi:hypothetical protein